MCIFYFEVYQGVKFCSASLYEEHLIKKGVKCVVKIQCCIIRGGFLLFMEMVAFTHLILYNGCFIALDNWEILVKWPFIRYNKLFYVKYVILTGFLTFSSHNGSCSVQKL